MPLTHEALQNFTGTEGYHRYSGLFRRTLLTDGAKYVAEQAGAYWLMDVIASHQSKVLRKDERCRDFQLWKVKVKNGKATVTCWADSGEGEKAVVTQRIPFTDFPLDEIQFYCNPCDWDDDGNVVARVILLKSEY